MPFSGSWNIGNRVAGAAALAVERVNADEALLPGRQLEYSWADSGCSAQQGLAAMGKLLGGASRVDAVIGPGCSSACEVTSHLSGGRNLAQIAFGCTSPTLSDKSKFQLVRTSFATRALSTVVPWLCRSLNALKLRSMVHLLFVPSPCRFRANLPWLLIFISLRCGVLFLLAVF